MPEVIDIRPAGGDRHDDEIEADDPPAQGRRVVLVAVAVVVAAFAVAYVVLGRSGHGLSATSGAAPDGAKAQVVDVAGGALQAWGRFAVSGRLEELTPYFDPDGPQFAQFRREAAELAGHPAGPEYRFAMSNATAQRKGDDWVVRGPVVVSRPGEADQRFSWELVVRPKGEGWAVWTVRESGGGPASTVGGKP